jgi:hypothetical protein
MAPIDSKSSQTCSQEKFDPYTATGEAVLNSGELSRTSRLPAEAEDHDATH